VKEVLAKCEDFWGMAFFFCLCSGKTAIWFWPFMYYTTSRLTQRGTPWHNAGWKKGAIKPLTLTNLK